MEKPKIAQKYPYTMECDSGEYWWCACGRSAEQPFCDGSHKGTKFRPISVKLEKPKSVSWCGCKQSSNKPFCDGTHNDL